MTYEDTRGKIQASFQESLSTVQASSDRIKREYVGPAVEQARVLSAARPLTAVFLLIFSALSFFPVLTFLGLSIFTLASLFFAAISLAFVVSTTIILFFGACLLALLTILFFLSLFLSSLFIFGYVIARLVVHYQKEPTPQRAVNAWFTEFVKAVIARIPIKVERLDSVPEGYELETVDPALGDTKAQIEEIAAESDVGPTIEVTVVKSEEKA